MDRELTKIEQKKERSNLLVRIVVIFILLVGIVWTLRHFIRPSILAEDLVVAPLTIGDIENRISTTGQTVPRFETIINASIKSQIGAVHFKPGDHVEPSDLIMSLNREFVTLQFESLKDELELKKNNVKKSEITNRKKVKDLRYEADILGLNIQSLSAELNDLKRLQEVGGATNEEVEKLSLDLQVKQLEKKKLENDLHYSKEIFERDQQNLNLEVNIQNKELRKLQRKLQNADLHSPSEGIITWINANIGQQVNEGTPLIRIADLTYFQVKGQISDRYASMIKIAQPVVIRFDDRQFKGHISSIPPEVTNNTLEFIAEFDHHPEVGLKPNMNVEVYLVTESKNKALLLKNGPGYRGENRMLLFKVENDQAVKVTADIGLVNREFIEIVNSPLKQGDRIIISDMRSYEGYEKLDLK